MRVIMKCVYKTVRRQTVALLSYLMRVQLNCVPAGVDPAPGDGRPRTVAFNFRCHAIGDESYEYAGLVSTVISFRNISYPHLSSYALLFHCCKYLQEADVSELREGLDMLKDHQVKYVYFCFILVLPYLCVSVR